MNCVLFRVAFVSLAAGAFCFSAIADDRFDEPNRFPVSAAQNARPLIERAHQNPTKLLRKDAPALTAKNAPRARDNGAKRTAYNEVINESAPEEPARLGGTLNASPAPRTRVTGGVGVDAGTTSAMAQYEGAQTPSLSVQKVAPAAIQVGKPAVFETRIRNVGASSAQSVEVIDQVPQGTRLLGSNPKAVDGPRGELIWSLDDLKPGEEVIVQMEVMPEVEGEIGSIAKVHFATEASARTICTKPELTIVVTSPKEVLIGDEVTLTVKVENPGTGVATGVVLSDIVPENFEHPAGAQVEYKIDELPPGGSKELQLTLKAVKAGKVANVIRAVGDAQLAVEDKTEIEVLAPALELAVDGPKKRYLDRPLTYTVSISNPGTAPAREVQLVTYLPAGMEFVEANNSGELDPQTNTVHWLLPVLPAGQTGTVTLVATPVKAGEQIVRVEGKAQQGLSVARQEAVVVEGVGAISFQVTQLDNPIEVGADTTYEIRVVNQGSKAAADVEVIAELPPQMKAIDGDGPTDHVIQANWLRFEKLTLLAPKADATFRVRATAIGAGDCRVKVQVRTADIEPVTKEESTKVYADE